MSSFARKAHDPEERKRSDAHSGQIFAMLVEAGPRGCTNSQLWTVCHAVNSRISDLRRRGYNISAESEGGGVWRYFLISASTDGPSEFIQRRRREEDEAMPLFAGGGR